MAGDSPGRGEGAEIMRFRSRNGLIALLALLLIAATAWAFSFPRVPPADFTFINENEITSVDPAMVIGQSEMRVIIGLFEGLVNWDPERWPRFPAWPTNGKFRPISSPTRCTCGAMPGGPTTRR